MQAREYISLNTARRKLKNLTIWSGFYIDIIIMSPLFFYIFIAAVIVSDTTNIIIHQEKNLLAYTHIFSDTPNTITRYIYKYQVVFLPYILISL